MSNPVYLPSDEFKGPEPLDLDLAADYLELRALFSADRRAYSTDIFNALDAAQDPFDDVNDETRARDEIEVSAVTQMALRKHVLDTSYPFEFGKRGTMICFTAEDPDIGQTAYLVSLLLSNLRSMTPLLDDNGLHPTEDEVKMLRKYFEYFATAAIAAEIGGSAWSFGFPREDGSGFREKLSEIWGTLRDGTVGFDASAPQSPKDDKVDIFAWRDPRDTLPGFLFVAAQVATGGDWKDKPIRDHINGVFQKRWFKRAPATAMIPYHVIPFARPAGKFRDDVIVLGNVLHRLRVPRRAAEAADLVQSGASIEAFNQLSQATKWVRTYIERVRAT